MKMPRGRMLELWDAAWMISSLATEENSFTTGAFFDLSGGRATYQAYAHFGAERQKSDLGESPVGGAGRAKERVR